jgi:hypothetical protein
MLWTFGDTFFNVLRITPSGWFRIGTGDFTAGSTQAARHEGFLFGPNDPAFSIVFVENDTVYLYGRLPAPNFRGEMRLARINFDKTTSVDAGRNVLPQQFALEQNYPNPFNPSQ